MVFKYRRSVGEVLAFGLVLGLFLVVASAHPAAAQFDTMTTTVTNFKTAIVTICSALCVVGLVGAGVGWMTRSQEGLGMVFWGSLTCFVIGALVLVADAIFTAIKGS